MRNTRRYGGYVVHFGMVLVFIGISGTAFNQDKQMDMKAGSVMTIGPYSLHLQNFDSDQQPNYSSERATIDVDKERPLGHDALSHAAFLSVQSRCRAPWWRFPRRSEEDLYVVYAGTNPDTNLPVIHAYLNPLVKWIWLGGVVVVLGTILALMPNRQAILVMSRATAAAASPVPGDPQPARASYSARSQLPSDHD